MKRKLFTALLLTTALVLGACGKTKTEDPAESTAESTAAESTVSDNSVSDNSVSDNDVSGGAVVSVSDNTVENDAEAGTAEAAAEAFDYTALPAFTAEDLEGNEVTNDLIAGKEITMVNMWGTFCAPCIAEMPDLEKLAQSLPENAQLIGLVCDVTYQNPENVPDAVAICDKAGATFTNIVLDQNLVKFTSQFFYVPTTFFVDSEGKMIGEAIIGANMNSYVERLEELLPGWTYEG